MSERNAAREETTASFTFHVKVVAGPKEVILGSEDKQMPNDVTIEVELNEFVLSDPRNPLRQMRLIEKEAEDDLGKRSEHSWVNHLLMEVS